MIKKMQGFVAPDPLVFPCVFEIPALALRISLYQPLEGSKPCLSYEIQYL